VLLLAEKVASKLYEKGLERPIGGGFLQKGAVGCKPKSLVKKREKGTAEASVPKPIGTKLPSARFWST